jgi:excisionase family DNA binding protein
MRKIDRHPERDSGKPTPDFLTRREVAERLQCCPKHVSAMVREGVIPSPLMLGRLPRWPKRGFEAWLACGCRPPHRPR